MNNDEREILEEHSDVERQFLLSRFLADKLSQPSRQFLTDMLEDTYDAIRAEILDYIISADLEYPADSIIKQIDTETSEIVRARLFLLLGYRGDIVTFLSYSFAPRTEYEALYWTAGLCMVDRRMTNFLKLSMFLFHTDSSIAETAVDLIVFVSSDSESGILRELFGALKQTNPALADKVDHVVAQSRLR